MNEQKPSYGSAWTRLPRALLLWVRRVQIFAGLVGRPWHVDRLKPRTAWKVACIVYDRPRRRAGQGRTH